MHAKASAGRAGGTLADCDEALRRMPGHADFLDSRGFTHLKMRQLPQALADYDAALKVDPGQATALFGRGVVRRQMGDVSGGDADIAAAIAIDAAVPGGWRAAASSVSDGRRPPSRMPQNYWRAKVTMATLRRAAVSQDRDRLACGEHDA